MAQRPISDDIILDTSRKISELSVDQARASGRVDLLERDIRQILQEHPELKARMEDFEKDLDVQQNKLEDVAEGQSDLESRFVEFVRELNATVRQNGFDPANDEEPESQAPEEDPRDPFSVTVSPMGIWRWLQKNWKLFAWLGTILTGSTLAWFFGWLAKVFAYLAALLS